jgi:hypothetical protein
MVGEVVGLSMLFSPIFTAGASQSAQRRFANGQKIGPSKRADR